MTSITVIAATSIEIGLHAEAVDRTLRALPSLNIAAEGRMFIKRSLNHSTWQEFILRGLAWEISTDYALIVQADGYAVHPENWDARFLEYDYIGAPWKADIAGPGTFIPEDRRVGNGGLSLRSRAWLEQCKSLPPRNQAEDVFCCRTHLEHFTGAGLKVAPSDLAAKFAFEWPVPGMVQNADNSWGVHGKWNL